MNRPSHDLTRIRTLGELNNESAAARTAADQQHCAGPSTSTAPGWRPQAA